MKHIMISEKGGDFMPSQVEVTNPNVIRTQSSHPEPLSITSIISMKKKKEEEVKEEDDEKERRRRMVGEEKKGRREERRRG